MTTHVDQPAPRHRPSLEDLAVQTIGALVAEGYTSSVMKLSRPVLNELARRLVTPGISIDDAAVQWLEDEGQSIARTNVYRFVQYFRDKLAELVAKVESELLFAELAADPRFDSEAIRSFAGNRIHQLIGQTMATATTLDELGDKRLMLISSILGDFDRGKIEQEKLELARDDAERKQRETQSKLDLAEQKISGVEDKIKALQSKLEELSKRAQRGKSIDPAIFEQIRNELMGVAA